MIEDIHPHGYWQLLHTDHHFDKPLATAIWELLKQDYNIHTAPYACCSTMVDLGCGDGRYVDYFANRLTYCDGYDGSPYTPIYNPRCLERDLSQPKALGTLQWGWVLCLEVGEHIPAEYESAFLDNVCNAAMRGIILSWAVKGQIGHGHVNCHENEYIESKLSERGWTRKKELETPLRNAAEAWWFKNTVMVYKR